METELMPVESSLSAGQLDRFKSMSSKDWWAIYGRQGAFYKTIDHEKYAQTINNLVLVKHTADWAIGRFVVELQKQIQAEFEEWDKKYYKDPDKKPEYTSAEAWFDDHRDIMRLSWRQAKRHRWVYLNVDFEFSDLGYKKNKAITDFIEDKETRRKFSKLIKEKRLNEAEVERGLELFISGLEDEARDTGLKKKVFENEVTERVMKKVANIIDHELKEEIEIKEIISQGKNVVIKCTRVSDAERVRDVLVMMESTIKLKAFRYQ